MNDHLELGPITINEFDEWLVTARPGDEITYFVGELARSVAAEEVRNKHLPIDAQQWSNLEIKNSAWHAHERGKVLLAQKRIRPYCFAYKAFKAR